MKKYQELEISIVNLEKGDVILNSPYHENELPVVPVDGADL